MARDNCTVWLAFQRQNKVIAKILGHENDGAVIAILVEHSESVVRGFQRKNRRLRTDIQALCAFEDTGTGLLSRIR